MTTSYPGFTAKTNNKYFLFFLIASAIPVVGVTYSIIKDPEKELSELNKGSIGLAFLLAFMLFVFAFAAYKYFFDTKNKLVINKEGVWTSRNGLVQWTSIWYIYQMEIEGRYNEQKLIIKLNESEKEIKLDTTYLDKSADEIIEALKHYSKDYNIQFLDKEIQ